MKKARLLIVDDEEIVRSSLSDWLKEDGYEILAVEDGYKAIEKIKQEDWDLALVDLKMPGMNGIEVLKNVHKIKPKLPVIIITAYATVDNAVMAMKEGAADYIMKPFNSEEISVIISRLVEHQRLIKENIRLRKELAKRFEFQDLVGKSPKMLEVFEMIKTVAPTKSTIIIRGESGTGKELIARAIHELSQRKKGSFIATACGAMPESLLEAELFGYEKGAFTGAVSQHKGRIEMAHAATNKNIEEMITRGSFREDLYYRLNVITINVPHLRERKEDIRILSKHFLEKFSLDAAKAIDSISEEVMRVLIGYNWPGNVRQLENVIEHAVVVTKGPQILLKDLPPYLIENRNKRIEIRPDVCLAEVEKKHILNVLKANRWNIKRSAQILGIHRITLYNKIKEYKLKKESKSSK
jgi:two-component system response regulator PilR (NtrC family)